MRLHTLLTGLTVFAASVAAALMGASLTSSPASAGMGFGVGGIILQQGGGGHRSGEHRRRRHDANEGRRRGEGERHRPRRRHGPVGGVIIRVPAGPPVVAEDGPPPPRVKRGCGPNEIWSRKRKRCFCSKGFKSVRGECVTVVVKVPPPPPPKRVADCDRNEVFSKRAKRCVCRSGFDRIGGDCLRPEPPVRVVVPPVPPPPRVRVVEPPVAPPPRVRQPVEEPDVAVAGPADTPPPSRAAPTPLPPIPLRKPSPVALAADAANCLPDDLYDLLEATYGRPPAAQRCDSACLPKPASFSEAQLVETSRRHGITWCESCIRLGGYLPLADILRIEQAAGVTLCMTDGARMCSTPGYGRADPGVTRTKVREVIRTLPVTLGKEGDIAVVIGNETYANAPSNANALGDADAVVTLLTEQLGYKPKNIIDLRNASRADLQRVFGGPDGTPGELAALNGPQGERNIFIYASTFGMVDDATGKSYLLPVDARLDSLADTAYSLDDLYAGLEKVGARTTLLALEASFSSNLTPFIDPPNLPELEKAVLPETPVPGLAVLTASDRDQRTLDDPEFGISLFTRYLIEGLAGKADEGPVGNADRRIDSVELYVFTANMVRQSARKSFGLEQKPIMSRVDNLLIGRLAQQQ